jgi:hypothetical protein
MINHVQTNQSSAVASCALASRPLELLEARQRRDSLKTLLRTEQSAMADFLVALADFDLRRGWEALGHASLFAFLIADLGLSTSSTYWRQSAARLLQQFPEVERYLRQGRLCLTTMAELAKVMTRENREEILPRFLGISSREAKEIVAELQPRDMPPLRSVVTSLALVPPLHEPAQAPSAVSTGMAFIPPATRETLKDDGSSEMVSTNTDPESLRAPEAKLTQPARGVTPRDDVEPLTVDLRRLHITVGREFLRDMEKARNGLSHAIPNATTEQVLQEGLRLLLEKQARARGQVKRPRRMVAATPNEAPAPILTPATQPTPRPATASDLAERRPYRRDGSREVIPAAVKRAVWERDQGRCNWPIDGGGVCGATHRLELDHIVPWAEWGGETEANLRVVCRTHNRLAARKVFGERVMGRYMGGGARGAG